MFVWSVPTREPTDYQLYINSSSGNVYNQWLDSVTAGCGVSTCAVTSPVTLALGDYQWWLRAKNATGNGKWAGPVSFKIVPVPPEAPVLISPIGGATANVTPVFTFSHSPTATWYLMEVRQSSVSGRW